MYQYLSNDKVAVSGRVDEFRRQTDRFLNGQLSEDQFRPLRLLNGLYVERQAPMLRVAIPYGELSSDQLRGLAFISRQYDRGYGHITTRQNIQFNWPEIPRVPDLLGDLATLEMHAVQSSGNCIRNITTDHLAGLTLNEVADPRPYCELIRQWANFHPEFAFLPRKFKIAVTGADQDRAASQVHDIGLHLKVNEAGDIGFEILVGGGLGRTPFIGQVIKGFLHRAEILNYLEALLRVYNLNGRRDNKYKSRIKILVNSMGMGHFRAEVEAEYRASRSDQLVLTAESVEEMEAFFFSPIRIDNSISAKSWMDDVEQDGSYLRWYKNNIVITRNSGYRAVYIALKEQHQSAG